MPAASASSSPALALAAPPAGADTGPGAREPAGQPGGRRHRADRARRSGSAPTVGGRPPGRRELVWDGVPDEFAAPCTSRQPSARTAPRARARPGRHRAITWRSARRRQSRRRPGPVRRVNPAYVDRSRRSAPAVSPIGAWSTSASGSCTTPAPRCAGSALSTRTSPPRDTASSTSRRGRSLGDVRGARGSRGRLVPWRRLRPIVARGDRVRQRPARPGGQRRLRRPSA